MGQSKPINPPERTADTPVNAPVKAPLTGAAPQKPQPVPAKDVTFTDWASL